MSEAKIARFGESRTVKFNWPLPRAGYFWKNAGRN